MLAYTDIVRRTQRGRSRAFFGATEAILALFSIACSGQVTDSHDTAPTDERDVEPTVDDAPTTRSADEVGGPDAPLASEELDATASCISAHPALEPFDAGGAARPDPVTGDMTLRTLEDVVTECESDRGTECDAKFISKEAARCIAESLDFSPGLEPWRIGLGYHYGYQRITWGVSNLLQDRGADGASGSALSLNAVDGSLIARLGWDVSP